MQAINRQRITVIGAGALGKWLAARLANVGHEMVMVTHREEQARAIIADGITVTDQSGNEWRQRVHAVSSDALLAGRDKGDKTSRRSPAGMGTHIGHIILVCVKSLHLEHMRPLLAHLLASETLTAERDAVVSFQNGLGNLERLATMVGSQSLLGAVITHGCTDMSLTAVSHRGQGTISVGSFQGKDVLAQQHCAAIVACFNEARLNASMTNDLQEALWTKAAVNCAINPLTALLRVTNGSLLQESLKSVAREIVQEVMDVAAAEGIQLEHVWDRVEAICSQTATNRSSMLQDVEHHRPTEIEALNGAIVRIALRHGRPVPVNTTITNLIRSMSHSRTSP